MARPPKKGLGYFPKSTDFYDDDKIIDLLEEYGPLGLTIYDVVITIVYKNGYYLELPVDKLASLAVRYIGNRWIKQKSFVIQVIHYCADIGLFDKDLLLQNVITSVGIQERYSEVTARNKADKSKYWLLEKNPSHAVSVCAPFSHVSETKTGVYATETKINDVKMQQSKVNKSKLNESKVCVQENADNTILGKHGHVTLTPTQFNELSDKYGRDVILRYAEKIDEYIETSGKKPYNNHYNTFIDWLQKDNIRIKTASSFDIRAIEEHAKYHTPEV